MHFNRRPPVNKPSPPPAGPKPTLEIMRVPVYRVRYRKLEEFIQTVFRFDEFDFLLAVGLNPGECPEYIVDGTLPTSEWQRTATLLRAGRRTRNVPLILATLCADGYIPRGRYIIDTHPEPTPFETYTAMVQRTNDINSPECVAFKEKYRGNKQFRQQAEKLDAMWAARNTS